MEFIQKKATIKMLDRDGNVMETCLNARKDVDLKRVTYQNNQFMYGNVPLNLTLIGWGVSGNVYAARSEDESIELALKAMNIKNLALEEEAFRLIGGMCKVITGIKKQNIIVMPMMDGDMEFLQNKLHPTTVVGLCRSLAKTLQCLLARNIMYTDIKPANTLYKCTGKGTIDILLGDVGDVFALQDGETYGEYISTFPYPYKYERKDYPGEDDPNYLHLLEPMTRDTAERQLVWGVACFFFVMMTDNIQLMHNRNYTNKEFMAVRKQLAKSVETIPDAAVFAKALVDPTAVLLAEMVEEKSAIPKKIIKRRLIL